MEQLIFFALIIFFSIIESVARSKKKKGGGPLPEIPPEWEQPPPRAERRPRSLPQPGPSDVPSYDADPSFDDEGVRNAEATFDESKARDALEKGRARSSESMIPAEIWDEIAGMTREPARQEPTATPRPRPAPRPAPSPGPKRAPAPPPRPRPSAEPRRAPQPRSKPLATGKRATILAPEPAPEGVAAHAVHQSHAGYGTDPSGRAPSAEDRLDPLERVLGADAAAVRGQLRSHGAHALRQAVILHEVLGPPAADRPDRF